MSTTNTPPAQVSPEVIQENQKVAAEIMENVIFDAFCQKMASLGNSPRSLEHGLQMYHNALELNRIQQDPRVKAAHNVQSIDDVATDALRKQAQAYNLPAANVGDSYLDKAAALLNGDARVYNATMLLSRLAQQPAAPAA